MAVILLAVTLIILLASVHSCSPRIVERVVVQHDTTRIVQRDSVRFYDRDSIFIREKGDTIYKYVEKWRWRDRVRVDTVLRVRVDSVAVIEHEIVQVEKSLSAWQSFKIGGFWYLCGALALLLCYVFRKPLLSLLKFILKI